MNISSRTYIISIRGYKMKKLFFFCLLFILMPIKMFVGNPIVIPQAFISEFTFDASNNWMLEITFGYGKPYLQQEYDSICIKTLNGFTRLNMENIEDSTNLFVITLDSLFTPLTINRTGDRIKLYSYLSAPWSEPVIDSLVFGDYPDSYFDNLPEGYSIARIGYGIGFAKDKNPTIGIENDTLGTCGTLSGFIYDKNNNLVMSGNFILDNPLYINAMGSYTTSVFARKVSFRSVTNNYEPGHYQGVRIDTIKLNVNPDSLYVNDIHIVTDFIVNVEEEQIENNSFVSIINYPNPFNSTTNFIISVPIELRSKSKEINIYDLKGEKIFTLNASEKLNASWDGKDLTGNPVSTGIYYYQLVIGGSIHKNGKMILLK